MSLLALCLVLALLGCGVDANPLNPLGKASPVCMVARAGDEWRAMSVSPRAVLATARKGASSLGNHVETIHVRAWGHQSEGEDARHVAYCAGYLEGMLSVRAAELHFAAHPPREPSADDAAALRTAVARTYSDAKGAAPSMLALVVMQLRGMRDGYNAHRSEGAPMLSAPQLLWLNTRHELDNDNDNNDSDNDNDNDVALSAACVLTLRASDEVLAGEARAEGRVRTDAPALVERVVSGMGFEVASLTVPLVLLDDTPGALWFTSAGLSVAALHVRTAHHRGAAWVPRVWRWRAALHLAATAGEWARAVAGDDGSTVDGDVVGGEHSRWLVRDWKQASAFGTALDGFLHVVESPSEGAALTAVDMSKCVPGRTVRMHVDAASGEQMAVSWSDPLLQSFAWFDGTCALHNGTSAAVAAAAATVQARERMRCDLHRRSPHARHHVTTRVADTLHMARVLDTHAHLFYTPRFLENGAAARVLFEHGWAAVRDVHQASLVWLRNAHEFSPTHLHDGQLLNMLAGQVELTTKDRLSRHLAAVGATDVQPETYHVFLPDVCERFRALVTARRGRGDVWIQKRAGESMGKGMVIRDADATDWDAVFSDELNECRANSASVWRGEEERVIRMGDGAARDEKLIMQRYITRPLLVHERKWELRAYWAVLSVEPLLAVFTEAGTRRNAEPFVLGEWDNSRVHLTNTAQQRAGEREGPDLKWSWARMRDYLAEHHADVAQPGWWEAELLPTCKEQLRTVLRATRASLVEAHRAEASGRGHTFQLFRSDWIIDEHGHPWLTEAQLSPSLSFDEGDALKQRLIPPMLAQLFSLALEVNARKSVDGVGALTNLAREDAVWEWLWREGDE